MIRKKRKIGRREGRRRREEGGKEGKREGGTCYRRSNEEGKR